LPAGGDRLELDERVARVVAVQRGCLACCTEVGIWADRALESRATDSTAPSVLLTDRAVAVHSAVNNAGKRNALVERSDSVIQNRNEAMTRMEFVGRVDTIVAVVPVRAVDAFVTNAVNIIVTAVAESSMPNVAAARKQCFLIFSQDDRLMSTSKVVARIMSMLPSAQAGNAQVKVLAILAYNTLFVGESSNAGVAISRVVGSLKVNFLDNRLTVRDVSLRQQVSTVVAVQALSNATFAQVEIASVTLFTVVMHSPNGIAARVAVDSVSTDVRERSHQLIDS
jgi:hypothetical protein